MKKHLTEGGKIKKGRVKKSDEEKKLDKEKKKKTMTDKEIRKQKLKEQRKETSIHSMRRDGGSAKIRKKKNDLMKLREKLANL